MRRSTLIFIIVFLSMICGTVFSYCPYDHLFIGCNEDGIEGTADDLKLFVDCRQKYKNAENDGDRFYTLAQGGSMYSFVKVEPGYDQINDGSQSDHPVQDPNRCLEGDRNEDYQIYVECLAVSDNFKVANLTETILLDEPGDSFNHSAQPDTHMHLYYVWTGDETHPEPNELEWITYYLWDAKGKYSPSEPYSVACVKEPLAGDLQLDGIIDGNDLGEMSYYWLADNASSRNDYYERADCDYSGEVNFIDFAYLAENWLLSID